MDPARTTGGLGRRVLAVTACASVVLYLVVFSVGTAGSSYDVWASLVIVPVIIAVTVPVIVRTARHFADQSIIVLLSAALGLKLVGALVRYVVTLDVLSAADANSYHKAGELLATSFRHGIFTVDVGGRVIGTHFIEIVTGAVYTVIGPTSLGGFFVFAWLGFWGLYFFYRAFRLALPDADHRRYALLIFFLPSLLFWPSSIGKESWMLFSLGLTALGVGRLYAARRGAYLVLALGLLALVMARPHVAVLVMVALVAGYLVRPGRGGDPLVRTSTKLLGIAVLLVAGTIVVANASSFLGVDSFDTDTLNKTLQATGERTAGGGSTFSAPNAQSPTGFPVAVVTVLFRPFPFEAGGVGGLIASAEGIVLMVVAVTSWRRLRTIPRRLFRQPYLLMSTVFTLVFIFAFSSFGNFGILTRERTQVFPFVLVLLCVPARERRADEQDPDLPVAAAAGAGARRPSPAELR